MSAHRLEPVSAEELAAALTGAYNDAKTIEFAGHQSKRALGGPFTATDVLISTGRLARVLAYEPADLTISVQAGLSWADLTRVLADHNQMVPLDPPFSDTATVGGAIAADSSGPRRRRYGTARDMVIGMQFATAEGKLVNSGGMVVKNVTGLDMAKLMIGSFGTLACITKVNFKLFPRPEREGTFVFRDASVEKLIALRGTLLGSAAQPIALDLVNAAAGQGLGLELDTPFALLAKAEGSPAVVERYRREYAQAAVRAGVDLVEPTDAGAEALWAAVREFQAQAPGVLLRISTMATKLAEAFKLAAGESWLLARAANAVVYAACPTVADAARVVGALRKGGFTTLVESMPADAGLEQWADPGPALEAMWRLKLTFDPARRLNPGRLWGRI